MAMRPANLLPADLARGERQQLPLPAIAAVGAGCAVGVLLAGGYMTTHSKVTKRQAELASIQAQIAAVPNPPPVKASTISPALAAEKDARQAAVDQAMGSRTSWDRVLREVSLILPDDVWLKTLGAKAGAATPAAADPAAPPVQNSISLTGSTYSQEGVARLLTRLALVPHLDKVQLQSSSAAEVGGQQVVNFTISADVVNAGGS
jgi:Tfp pilus assembly protein PilN